MICTSMLDIRNEIELNKLSNIDNDCVVVATIKYVKRSNEEEDYYSKEQVLSNMKDVMPELEQANRLDVFNFYNNKLTNSVNRKMVSSIVKTYVKNGVIHQSKVYMENYFTDRAEIIKASASNEDFKHVINTFKLDYIIDDEKLLDELNGIINNTLSKEQLKKILPLVYVEKFNILSGTLPKLNNKRLERGETLLLTDKTRIGLKENASIKANTIFLDNKSDTVLLLDKVLDGDISVRKVSEEELFTTFYYKH